MVWWGPDLDEKFPFLFPLIPKGIKMAMSSNNAMDPWKQQLNIKTVLEYLEILEKKYLWSLPTLYGRKVQVLLSFKCESLAHYLHRICPHKHNKNSKVQLLLKLMLQQRQPRTFITNDFINISVRWNGTTLFCCLAHQYS